MSTKKGTNKNDKMTGGNGDDVLYGYGGNDILDGGKGDDDLMGGDGNDKFIGRFDGSDAIDGGKGIDTLDYSKLSDWLVVHILANGEGFTSKLGNLDYFEKIEVFKLSKNEDSFTDTTGISHGYQIFGGAGSDTITAGGSVMRGDAGFDLLVGNSATMDTFWLQRGKDADVVRYFTASQDTIWLDGDEFDLGAKVGRNELVFTSGSLSVAGDHARLIWNWNNFKLYYDPDGQGAKEPELIATFQNISGDVDAFYIDIV